MTDANAARRERAEKYLSSIHIFSSEEILWARRAAPGDEFGEGWLVGYLAGSREEAAIKDAEIGRLESLLDRARPLARKNLEQAAEIEELKAEIAALREAVLDIDGFIGTSPANQLAEWHRWEQRPEVKRAREGR